ncbi:MAG: lysophospholipid acyltransferase family protein [Chitinophagaceae bacterium]
MSKPLTHQNPWLYPWQVLHFLYAATCFVVMLIVFYPWVWLIGLLPEKKATPIMFYFMNAITPVWMVLSGIFPRRHNTQHVSPHRQYIITPNHQSYFDAAQVYRTINRPFKSLGKTDLLKVPLYGLMYKLTVIPVDRSNAQARATSVRRMKQHIDRGYSLLLFPEGTFPDTAQADLLRFQPGAFSLAIQYQVPVLPVLFPQCAFRMHPKQFWRTTPGITRTLFLPPIETAGLAKEHTAALTHYTAQYMQACLNEYRENGHQQLSHFAEHWRHKHPLEL